MKKVAITGGIGVGKTYISKQFIEMGIPVFYADDECKKLYDESTVKQWVIKNFGEQTYQNGQVSFPNLATIIFNDDVKKKALEKFLHPIVMQKFENWCQTYREFRTGDRGGSKYGKWMDKVPYVLFESAILFEAGHDKLFDKVIVVDAPLEVRIERIKKRNPNLSEEKIQKRIDSQILQELKVKRADIIIANY